MAGGSSEGLDKLKEVKTASVAMGQPVGLEKKKTTPLPGFGAKSFGRLPFFSSRNLT